MSEATQRSLSSNRKKRGVVRASITKLGSRVTELEAATSLPGTVDRARRLTTRLESLAEEFKLHHYSVIDLLDGEEDLAREQEIFDEQDEDVSQLALRLEGVISTCPASDPSQCKIATGRLKHLEKRLSSIFSSVTSFPADGDVCLLQQFEEQLSDFKTEFSDIHRGLISLDVDDTSELGGLLAHVEKAIFDRGLEIRRLLHSRSSSSSPSSVSDPTGVKLPKLDVPTFDGSILNWKTFWEQFSVAVHDRSNLTDAEKLAYLRHALKAGSAKSVIEGLSRSGEQYEEAITCLKSRYDRPRLIHQAHVRKILEIPNLKDGSGRELRRLHDTALQHLRALKSMGHEPSGPFITSMLELKLDVNTTFEWQRHSQSSTDVPHYKLLLEFINLRAQASEAAISDPTKKPFKSDPLPAKRNYRSVASFVASANSSPGSCVACKSENHPLYVCSRFKALSHAEKLSVLRTNSLCLNCLRPGHFVSSCKSLHKCRVCQKPHHTLLHLGERGSIPGPLTTAAASEVSVSTASSLPTNTVPASTPIATNAAVGIKSNLLLMTCRVLVESGDGSLMEARAILDSGSSASFVSERLTQCLRLPRFSQNTRITGVAGFVCNSAQHVTTFQVSSVHHPTKKFDVTAVVVPHVTSDLPLQPVPIDLKWDHLSDLQLADPHFGQPGRIDLLLGVEIFVEVMLHGRRCGIPGSPVAFETQFGWVLAGSTGVSALTQVATTHHATLLTGDDLLRSFWEVERIPAKECLTPDESAAVTHFEKRHTRLENGRFLVPLPKKAERKPLGESRSQAVRRFLAFERSLHSRGLFPEFKAVIEEYFTMDHAEPVPAVDLEKPPQSVFYLPMHAVRKQSSTTTKVRAVFDASAKTSTGISLNDTLLVGPTVHSSLVDVLLRFRLHRVALIADVSKMYRAIALTPSDRDLHRFVWRDSPDVPLKDCRMTRVTFGVSASSFIANMSVRQNALDHALAYPLAAKAVEESFYVDDGLMGADSIEEAIELHVQLQTLFDKGGFLLRKWNSSEYAVLQHIAHELRDQQSIRTISEPDEYTKTLGVEWNANLDHFRLTVAELSPQDKWTKRALSSDIAKTFDVLGWFAPVVIKAKILLQRLWEEGLGWDDAVPPALEQAWLEWRQELRLLVDKHIPRCYYPKSVKIGYRQLHGFSDASEEAYAGVVYFRFVDTTGCVHTSLVMAKTKVAPIKRLSIPRLELCGAFLLAQLLNHCQTVFNLSTEDIFAWTDSTIVLSWLVGNPRRFKTFVGNRVSLISDLVAPSRWSHVEGLDNPADCASRGLLPSELLSHALWWNGPKWLQLGIHCWPKPATFKPNDPPEEVNEIYSHAAVVHTKPVFPLDRFSSFTRLKRVTAWMLRFIFNCQSRREKLARMSGPLAVSELNKAVTYWVSLSQSAHFASEIVAVRTRNSLPKASPLLSLNPFLDEAGLLRVGGRQQNSNLMYDRQHPIILHWKHPMSKLLIRTEHLRLLHAGPLLVAASLGRRFYIVGGRKSIRSTTRSCVICRRKSLRPQPPIMGQLPAERVTPDLVFNRVGVDYAGPIYVKYGYVRKPTLVKAYVCVFVSLSVKAVHLELVSDLTTEAFVACLRRFIARRGKPSLVWSDHGSNFVGASRHLKELTEFLQQQQSQEAISNFCSSQNIVWKFIPERAPHFGGLWEAAVKSFKKHLSRVVGEVKLTFEELTTVLAQIEACLNSRPLTALPCVEDSEVAALTPGHFLIGRPLEALPDPVDSFQPLTLLKRWHLCQALIRHFWKRWSTEYLASLQKANKWRTSASSKISVGDVVVIREDETIPGQWPLARVIQTHPGKDGVIRVVTIRTGRGNVYTRPVVKTTLLLP